ncbi:hypothetical protein EK904_012858 [Melospiza melodia maxima]|nr:hypothetical protein EK904_012858 [Melospiza melodia maxima]
MKKIHWDVFCNSFSVLKISANYSCFFAMTYHCFAKTIFPPNSYDLDRNPATNYQLQRFKGITETSREEGEYGYLQSQLWKEEFQEQKVLLKTFFIITAVGALSAGEALTCSCVPLTLILLLCCTPAHKAQGSLCHAEPPHPFCSPPCSGCLPAPQQEAALNTDPKMVLKAEALWAPLTGAPS